MNLSDICYDLNNPPNLLDILHDFYPDWDENWNDTLDGIEDAVLDYNEAIADEVENPGDSLNGLLPIYWQIVRAHNIYKWGVKCRPSNSGNVPAQEIHELGVECHPSNSGYDVGIFLVGFRSLPIVLSIAEIQPCEEIYFLHSPETGHKCNEITNRIREMLKDPPPPLSPLIESTDAAALIGRIQQATRCKIANPSDPVETFKEIKRIIDSLASDKKIALDLTGGKKTMIGGGFTAGSIYSLSPKCDMFYVDSSEYDPAKGAPKSGTEFLSQLDNPYDVYNVQSLQEAEALFYEHNYEAAASLWDTANEKLNTYAKQYGLQNEQVTVQKNLYMANCYDLWDAFDYIAAKEFKNDHRSSWDYDAKHIYNSIDALDILGEITDLQTLFDTEARIIHYGIDRYENGIRRMDVNRYDDAIVRFTQVVEILCRYHIYQIAKNRGLTDESHDPVEKQCCLDEEWSITKLIHFLFGKYRTYRTYDGLYRIAHLDQLLQIDNYCDYNNTDDITNLIRPRNDFVHVKSNPGWEEMEDNATELQELAQKFLENFSRDYLCKTGLSFDELLELHRFRL